MKLVLSPEVQMQVDEILAPLINPALWAKMNLSFAKFPYAIVRMEGLPGCLTGFNLVEYKNNNHAETKICTLETFFRLFNKKVKGKFKWRKHGNTFLRSYDTESGKLRFNKVVSVIESGYKHCIEIITQSGKKIQLTKDHPLIDKNGLWKQAGQFRINSIVRLQGSLRPTNNGGKSKRPKRKYVETLKYYAGTHNIHEVNGTKYQRTAYARIVVEAKMNGITTSAFIMICKRNLEAAKKLKTLPKNTEVHHKDENPSNDCYDNLEIMTKVKHSKHHSKVENFDVEWTIDEKIVSIKDIGIVYTYDIQMEAPYHNFVCSDFIVHNTGKTALAQYMARRLKQAPLEVSFDKVASPMLGETEKAINQLFHTANETETKTIIMEECDALLWSRSLVTEDTVHMLGFINTLLTCIDKFRQREIPSLLILTSNHPEKLDSALESRITDLIHLFPPVGKQAEKLWLAKLPECMLEDTKIIEKLATLQATPRQMENAILKISRRAIKQNRLPTFQDFELA